jgi:2-amino-4-hydroxy-6-hydroxymethyldihydropteridine diphosphokinase
MSAQQETKLSVDHGERLTVVALGSNLGESRQIIQDALSALQRLSEASLRSSSLWMSEPIDCPAGSAWFVNAVCLIKPGAGETPESFLSRLQQLERQFGRTTKQVRNESRSLDLDLVAFGQERRNSNMLILPHPRAHLRRFVLQPLAEIVPDYRLPGQALTVAELLQRLPPGVQRIQRMP